MRQAPLSILALTAPGNIQMPQPSDLARTLIQTERERDSYREEAAEAYALRGEVIRLREDLAQELAAKVPDDAAEVTAGRI